MPQQFDANADQVREFNAHAEAATDRREIAGIGVPLGTEIEVWRGFREVFDPECVFEGIDRAKLMTGHRTLIGVIAEHERTAESMNITGRVSKIAAGDEALELARDGALDSFSIGFRAKTYEETEHEDGSYTVRHKHVLVREFSLTPVPAYTDALVTEVRERPTAVPVTEGDTTMTDTLTREEVDTLLTERDADFERNLDARLAQLGTREASPIGAQWRTAGDFLKALAAGDTAAADFHREYTGGVIADGAPKATWIADAIKLVDRPRKIINRFGRQTLPPTGNVLEWYQLKSDSTTVTKQAAEGDDLPFGKVELETKTTNVETYGGYTELSRQAIERSTSPLLSTAHRAQAIAYARATEAAARAFFAGVRDAQVTAGNVLERPAAVDLLTVSDWLDLIVDASDLFDDRGFALDRLQVSKDVFKQLYRLEDGDGRRLMNVYGAGVNQVGEINVRGVSGNVANVPVDIIPGSAADTIVFTDPVAIDTFESPGAPLQLQDENIINLSKTFSVYGYASWANPFPTAIVPVVAEGTEPEPEV